MPQLGRVLADRSAMTHSSDTSLVVVHGEHQLAHLVNKLADHVRFRLGLGCSGEHPRARSSAVSSREIPQRMAAGAHLERRRRGRTARHRS